MSDKGRHAKWVSQYVGDNQWVKRVDGQYYLYGMEDGKELLLGIITKEGFIESDESLERRTCTVYEYGASKALPLLCPSRWKESMGASWEQVLLYIIYEISPTSYLLRQGNPERLRDMKHLARKKLDLFLVQECGFSIREIFSRLGGVKLLIDNETGEQRFSKLSDEQLSFARSLNLNLEVQ